MRGWFVATVWVVLGCSDAHFVSVDTGTDADVPDAAADAPPTIDAGPGCSIIRGSRPPGWGLRYTTGRESAIASASPDLFPPVFTYEMWVAIAVRPEVTMGFPAYLLHGQTPGTEDKIFLDVADVPAQLRCRIVHQPDGTLRDVITSVPLDTIELCRWTHLACTYDGSELRLYVDGVRRSLATGAGYRPPTDTSPLGIGNDAIPGIPTDSFLGTIDSVRISRTARYDGETIDVPVALGRDADTTVLWPFEEGTGFVAHDPGPPESHAVTLSTTDLWTVLP